MPMSRSRKKSPAGGIAKAGSDKWHKTRTARATRHKNKLRIHAEKEVLALPREVVNQYDSPKDGHTWFGWKVALKYPKILRK
jgi:hypothetical protein